MKNKIIGGVVFAGVILFCIFVAAFTVALSFTNELHKAQGATCTESGTIAYYENTITHRCYSADDWSYLGKSADEDFKEAISYGEKDLTNHVGGTEVKNAVTATCTQSGYTGDTYCNGCGTKLSDGTTTASGHKAEKTEAKAATCTEAGNIEYWYCSVCDGYFSNESCTNEITKAETVAEQLVHSYDPTVTKPTCTGEGYTTYVCINCGDTFIDDYVDATGHNIDGGKCTNSGCGYAVYTRVDADGNESSTGSYILFGSYPQSEVGSNLASALSLAAYGGDASKLPTSSNSNGWTDYGYYISGSVTSYMWYTDVEYKNEKYRGVYFTSYRPYYTTISSSNTYQDDNGYSTSTVYWFKYEPIKWRILSESDGTAMLLAEMIIDSQEYYNQCSSGTKRSRTAVANYDDEYYLGNDTTARGSVYDNNYLYSNIRKWLNESFYKTAFSDLQKELIKTTEVDNSALSTENDGSESSTNSYACADTKDKVFLLSQKEVTTTSYGFATNGTADTARQKKTTDYARCQGAYTYSTTGYSYTGCGYWWLRSPLNSISYYARYVDYNGSASISSDVSDANYGVVPALNIQL